MKPFLRRFHGWLHPLPFTCFLLAILLDCFFLFTQKKIWSLLSVYVFTAGIAAGWLSFLTGLLSLFLLRKNSMAAGLGAVHGFLGSLAMMIFTLLWMEPWHALPHGQPANGITVAFKMLSLLVMTAAIVLAKKYLRPQAKEA